MGTADGADRDGSQQQHQQRSIAADLTAESTNLVVDALTAISGSSPSGGGRLPSMKELMAKCDASFENRRDPLSKPYGGLSGASSSSEPNSHGLPSPIFPTAAEASGRMFNGDGSVGLALPTKGALVKEDSPSQFIANTSSSSSSSTSAVFLPAPGHNGGWSAPRSPSLSGTSTTGNNFLSYSQAYGTSPWGVPDFHPYGAPPGQDHHFGAGSEGVHGGPHNGRQSPMMAMANGFPNLGNPYGQPYSTSRHPMAQSPTMMAHGAFGGRYPHPPPYPPHSDNYGYGSPPYGGRHHPQAAGGMSQAQSSQYGYHASQGNPGYGHGSAVGNDATPSETSSRNYSYYGQTGATGFHSPKDSQSMLGHSMMPGHYGSASSQSDQSGSAVIGYGANHANSSTSSSPSDSDIHHPMNYQSPNEAAAAAAAAAAVGHPPPHMLSAGPGPYGSLMDDGSGNPAFGLNHPGEPYSAAAAAAAAMGMNMGMGMGMGPHDGGPPSPSMRHHPHHPHHIPHHHMPPNHNPHGGHGGSGHGSGNEFFNPSMQYGGNSLNAIGMGMIAASGGMSGLVVSAGRSGSSGSRVGRRRSSASLGNDPSSISEVATASAAEESDIPHSSYTRDPTPRRYICQVCHKRFTRPSTLRTHMNSHTESKKNFGKSRESQDVCVRNYRRREAYRTVANDRVNRNSKHLENHLQRLKEIREKLFNLRKATGSARQSKETSFLWKEVSGIVKSLADLRSKDAQGGDGDSSFETDQILEDIIPMFFQFWSSNGKVSEHMYPVYVKLAKLNHTLDHWLESGLYTTSNLADAQGKLKDLEDRVHGFAVAHETKDKGRKQGLALLQSKLNAAIHTRLNEIKSELQNLLRRGSSHAFSLAEVQMLQDELREIDSVRIDGSFLGKDGAVLPGQAAVIALIESSYEDVHELLSMREAIAGDNPLRSVYERLIKIKGNLERISMVYRWALRAEDLVQLQMELGSIDNLRVDGKFLDEKGQVPEGQAVLHFLLHKRVDGKYLDADGTVPEGQGILHGLLNECYDVLRALQHVAEENEGLDDDDDDDDLYEEEEEDEDEDGNVPHVRPETRNAKLPYTNILKVGPIGEKPALLYSAYTSSLNLCKEYGLKSVAFPCISTGVYGYPPDAASHVALSAVREWMEESDDLDVIIFCIFLQSDYDIYVKNIPQYFPTSIAFD
ncbi:hypothetical protein HDU97_000738 [Phlyctochytrium planicorne]|nr:hypothetical protein HDU97_000738 [Phlyctochytrium planicorne]